MDSCCDCGYLHSEHCADTLTLRQLQQYSASGLFTILTELSWLPRKHVKQGRQGMYTVTMRPVRGTIVAVERLCITYFECVFVGLGIQHALRMGCIVTRDLPGCAVFFPH